MTLKEILFVAIACALASGCNHALPQSAAGDPHGRWWSIGFTGPAYMEGWLETASVEDEKGVWFTEPGGGMVGYADPSLRPDAAIGWSGVGGTGRAVVGASWPVRIKVRWQSLAEQNTYSADIELSNAARSLMRRSVSQRCAQTPDLPSPYRATVTLGLAPSGVVQMWVWDECDRPVAVDRAQADIEPLGPYQGQSDGHYYPQSEASKRYIERYGIPYGSW